MSEKTKEEIEREIRYRQSIIKGKIAAYIRRAVQSGMPEKYMRTNSNQFSALLDKSYHGANLSKIVDFIYNVPPPDKDGKLNFPLLNIPFIVIDGGNIEARKMAAFAIMFRMITCDRFAKFWDCNALVHRFNTFDARNVEIGGRRTDLADDLKDVDVLFLSEFRKNYFNEKCDGGNFMDEVLDARRNGSSPTIITFQDTINQNNSFKDLVCGKYLSDLSLREYCGKGKDSQNPSSLMLRIRVKTILL